MLLSPIRSTIAVVAILAVVPMGSSPAAEPRPLPAHPRLLLDRQGVTRIRQKVQQSPWDKVWAEFKAEMDQRLRQEVELPPRGGNWSHNYVCPTHGARLNRGKQIGPWQWEHHGTWSDLPPGQAFTPPDAPGYKCLRGATTRNGDSGTTLTVRHGDNRSSKIVLAAGGPTEVITGTGIGGSTEDRVPLAVFRRVARETVYAWAVSLDGAPVALKAEAKPDGLTSVAIKTPSGSWQFSADPNQGNVHITAP